MDITWMKIIVLAIVMVTVCFIAWCYFKYGL